MKAAYFTEYGAPEKVMFIKDIEKPTPKENEILIKVHASAVNDYDWNLVTGKPKIYRLMFGLFKPKHPAGMEVSGVIEAIGSKVKKWRIGEAVYGDISNFAFGAFAEYLAVNENALVKKPDEMSFEDAASLPHASLLALQGLRDMGNIKTGQKILINGGGGGVGTFGLQIAKTFGCEVSGVDSEDKLDMMKAMGFDHVIDYRKEDFTKMGIEYDLILDCKSTKSPFVCLKALKESGKYISIGGKISTLISLLFWGNILSLFSKKRITILALKSNEGLGYIQDLYHQKKIKCVIDGPHPFKEIPRLVQYFGDGKHKGKIVVQIA
jgi:NADPH:quinone reductase-like Zn-dependent oxidoreductase